MKRILAVDIGATNGRFAVFNVRDAEMEMEQSVWLKTREVPSFAELVRSAGERDLPAPETFDIAVFAVCGPVDKGVRSVLSNLDWDIDLSSESGRFGFRRCLLINDFVAQAYGCRTEAAHRAEVVQSGEIDHDSPLITIGAGTGLGHCALLPDHAGGFLPVPSEGGHASLQMCGPEEEEFARFALKKTGAPYVFNEMAVSGSGLALIHEFLTGDRLEPGEVSKLLTPDHETAAWFSRFYARTCRNYALTVLALGGVYITGGVTAKNPVLVHHPNFRREFAVSPAHGKLLESIPIFLNTNEEVGLYGAALCGKMALRTFSGND